MTTEPKVTTKLCPHCCELFLEVPGVTAPCSWCFETVANEDVISSEKVESVMRSHRMADDVVILVAEQNPLLSDNGFVRVCAHEAAHAILAKHFGGTVQGIDVQGNGEGLTTFQISRGIDIGAMLTIFAAGVEAEHLTYRAPGPDSYEADLLKMKTLWAHRVAVMTDDEIARQLAEQPAVFQKAHRRARALVTVYYRQVLKLAILLARGYTASEDDVNEIFEGKNE